MDTAPVAPVADTTPSLADRAKAIWVRVAARAVALPKAAFAVAACALLALAVVASAAWRGGAATATAAVNSEAEAMTAAAVERAAEQAATKAADLAAERTAAAVRAEEAEKRAAARAVLAPYVVPVEVSARTVKPAVYGDTWSIFRPFRKMPKVEAGLGARILDKNGKVTHHAKDGKWVEGEGPTLALP